MAMEIIKLSDDYDTFGYYVANDCGYRKCIERIIDILESDYIKDDASIVVELDYFKKLLENKVIYKEDIEEGIRGIVLYIDTEYVIGVE